MPNTYHLHVETVRGFSDWPQRPPLPATSHPARSHHFQLLPGAKCVSGWPVRGHDARETSGRCLRLPRRRSLRFPGALPTWDVTHSPTHTHFLAPAQASIMIGAVTVASPRSSGRELSMLRTKWWWQPDEVVSLSSSRRPHSAPGYLGFNRGDQSVFL